ncbi:MAG: ATP synthase subunit I [Sideroxydans sp.]|nr:ATP synthase subunit I [Sideroxydans sp.]
MTEPLSLAIALAAGILLGVFFFGGLWWTVRKGIASKHAALWFGGSMLLRTAVVTLGFYWVMGDSWQRLLAALTGFIVARLIVTRLTNVMPEADHAS